MTDPFNPFKDGFRRIVRGREKFKRFYTAGTRVKDYEIRKGSADIDANVDRFAGGGQIFVSYLITKEWVGMLAVCHSEG
jgi:hypothetical protein